MIKELQPIRKKGNDLAVIAPDEYAVLWRMSIESKINEILGEVNNLDLKLKVLMGEITKAHDKLYQLEKK